MSESLQGLGPSRLTMASYNTFDAETVRANLEAWLPAQLGVTNLRVTDLETPAASGASALTFLFDCRWEQDGQPRDGGFVARVVPADPSRGGLFMSYDLELEAALIRAAGRVVPTPDIIAVEPANTEVLGGPFIITRLVPGRVVSDNPPLTSPDSWAWELTAPQQSKLADECLRAMTAVQSVEPSAVPSLASAPTGTRALIDHWERVHHWGRRAGDDRPNPAWDDTLLYLRDQLPADEPEVLNWGDSRIGNMIYDDNLDAVAVLDWEMACVGSPEIDLGWFLFHMRWTTDGFGLPQLPGFPSEAEVIRRFEELSGRAVHHAAFFTRFAALRMVALGARYAVLLEDAGLMPADADFARTNPGAQVALRLLDELDA